MYLIDSLHPGGAERMAVLIANSMTDSVQKVFLCASRETGLLSEQLNGSVKFYLLNRKSRFDFNAILRLSRFIRDNEINLLHAHSTSLLLAVLVKVLVNVKLIWHHHFGNEPLSGKIKVFILKQLVKYTDHSLFVSETLRSWAMEKLNLTSSQSTFLPNCVSVNSKIFKEEKQKKIVCVANFRKEKDHFTLIKAFKKVHEKHSDWQLLLVGKNFADQYYADVLKLIDKLEINHVVELIGESNEVSNILAVSKIGVLSSKFEGMPLALLEYGAANLAVVATKVGACESVLQGGAFGSLINSEMPHELANMILRYIENEELCQQHAAGFYQEVKGNFSIENYSKKLNEIYSKLIGEYT